MGLPITKVSDYSRGGSYSLPLNKLTIKEFTPYIEETEERWLCYLLGKELSDLFLSDLDPVTNLPVTPRFIEIYERFFKDSIRCSLKLESIGIKSFLQGLVCFYYLRSNNISNGMMGAQSNDSENSIHEGLSRTQVIQLYNQSVETLKNIQEFICDNMDTYPEFKGINKGYLTLI